MHFFGQKNWFAGSILGAFLSIGMTLTGSAQSATGADAAKSPPTSYASPVLDWNDFACKLAVDNEIGSLDLSRNLTVVSLAVHDALNLVDRRYEMWEPGSNGDYVSPLSNPMDKTVAANAAVAAAASAVLNYQYPSSRKSIQERYNSWIAKSAGLKTSQLNPQKPAIKAGNAAAKAVLDRRAHDGADSKSVPWPSSQTPGHWSPVPPLSGLASAPVWAQVQTFMIKSVRVYDLAQQAFRDITSSEYAKDYNEVKDFGSLKSTARNSEQSGVAKYWYEASNQSWNRIARILLNDSAKDEWDKARILALMNAAMADAYVTGWYQKYKVLFWRPYSAIRAGDEDGNDETSADPGWQPFLATPPMPEYPSTHSVLSAAAAAVLRNEFGSDDLSFSAVSGLPYPGISRHFDSLSAAVADVADARVWAGVHFRSSCTAGIQVGEAVAKDLLAKSFASLVPDGVKHSQFEAKIPESVASPGELDRVGSALKAAYPGAVESWDSRVPGGLLVLKNGQSFVMDDGREKNHQELFDNADIQDMFILPYPHAAELVPPAYLDDPGRYRNTAFFKALYGATEAAVRSKLSIVRWPLARDIPIKPGAADPGKFGSSQPFNKEQGAADALAAVLRDLSKKPELLNWLLSPGGTFNWRPIAGSSNLSIHSFAVAADIKVAVSAYWYDEPGAAKAGESAIVQWRNQIPLEVVQTFEAHGFIWGGRWYHYDTMHFEFRPELFAYEKIARG